ncbi:MAG: fatty acid desaturase [Acidimicrobiales bacterium]
MPLLTAIVTGLLVCQVAILVTTVYLHRSLAHRAVSFSRPVEIGFRGIVWMTTGLKPRAWVAVHRKHHAFTDVAGDPHSPKVDGFWTVQLANAWLYKKAASDEAVLNRYAKDLSPDRLDALVFDRAWLGLAIGTTVLVVLLGPIAGLVAAGVEAASYLLLSAAVNAIGHTFGRRPYENSATNNQWLAWFTAGEGLHNNHHAASTSAKLSFSKGQIDPGWALLALLKRLGWAKVRHETPRLRSGVRETARSSPA